MLVTIEVDDFSKLPPISDERIKEILAFKDEDISDCPELTPEQLVQLRPYKIVQAEREKRRLKQTQKAKLAHN
jgi:hypothetical protein